MPTSAWPDSRWPRVSGRPDTSVIKLGALRPAVIETFEERHQPRSEASRADSGSANRPLRRGRFLVVSERAAMETEAMCPEQTLPSLDSERTQ